MKRYDLELTATGPVMEESKEGAFVPFSEVDLLKHHINQYQEERSSTGMAISNAILSGIVPEQHPLRSRLELLANHHKREQALAELLRRARRYVSPLSRPESEIQIVQSIVSSIDSVLAGQLPDPAVTVTETIHTAPERIWLQVGDQSHYHSEPFPSDTSEVSWCADSVVGCEVPYVRADLACQVPVHKEMQGWLPIETAPHDGSKALVYRPLAENSGDERIAVKRLTGGRSNSCWDKTVPPGETPCNPTDGACHVTHWMPLPDEPAQQGGEPCDSASPSSSPD